MRPKEVAFTRIAIRQLAGLPASERDLIRSSLAAFAADPDTRAARIEPSRAPPIFWLGSLAGWIAAVEGDERLVVLRLGVEADSAILVLRDLAIGREERVPERIAARLLDGENAVKVWRGHRGATQARLAKKAGINADYLSQIETGRRHASDEVKSALLRALAIDALDFGLLIDLPRRKRKKR